MAFPYDVYPGGSGYPPPSNPNSSNTWNKSDDQRQFETLISVASMANEAQYTPIPAHMLPIPPQSQPLVPCYTMPLHASLQIPFYTQPTDSPLLSDTHSPTLFASAANNGFPPYPNASWEEQEWREPSPPGDHSSPDADEQTSRQEFSAAVRRQRRIESERRYRSRTDFAYNELVDSFTLWNSEIPFPNKKTKEAQLRHAARLIRRGADYSRKMKQLALENHQLRQRLAPHQYVNPSN